MPYNRVPSRSSVVALSLSRIVFDIQQLDFRKQFERYKVHDIEMIVRSEQSRVGALEAMVLALRQASYVFVLGLEDQVLDTVLEAPVLSLDLCQLDSVPGATFSKHRKILKISYLRTIFDNIWEKTNQT